VTLAALIILGDDSPTAPVLGLSWPEFQLRRAVQAGALHLVLVADRVGRDVVEAIDRLRGEGLPTTLVRTNADVADLFHPDEAVLMMTGGWVVSDERLSELLVEPELAILCIDAERAGPGHELIDARSHWAGFARLDGALVRVTATMPGDWDLGSMLLRKAAAARAKRIMLPTRELLEDASTPAGAATAARALVGDKGVRARGWGERSLIAPLTMTTLKTFPGVLPVLARFGPVASLILLAAAPALQLRQWTSAALVMFLVALLVAAAARLAAAATGIAGRVARLIAPVRDVAASVLLGVIALERLPDLTAVVLSAAIVSFVALTDRLPGLEGTGNGDCLADIPGNIAILLVASMFSPVGLVAGLTICALHGLASLAILQNRLSRVLTSLR
jgi:hypothetical protein